MGTKTAFVAVSELSGITYTENLPDRRVLIKVAEQTEIAVRKFYAYSVAYICYKNNLRVSPSDFVKYLTCLPELGGYYNADVYVGPDQAFEKYVHLSLIILILISKLIPTINFLIKRRLCHRKKYWTRRDRKDENFDY